MRRERFGVVDAADGRDEPGGASCPDSAGLNGVGPEGAGPEGARREAARPDDGSPDDGSPDDSAPDDSSPNDGTPNSMGPHDENTSDIGPGGRNSGGQNPGGQNSGGEHAPDETTGGAPGTPENPAAENPASSLDSSAPENATPENATSESSAPDSSAPESSAPESSAPESSVPDSSASDSSSPESSVSAEATDAELIAAVRQGVTAAYQPLYERHLGAARGLARQVARSSAEADDLVSEAFAKVLDTLRGGGGPDEAFRAYLLTALRRTAYDRSRRERRIQLADDVAEVSGADLSVPFTDTAVAGLERSMVGQAFEQLPERWRAVLWHVEVEGEPPSEVAPMFGLTPNGVSALAYRAREGLRQAYLQAHLGELGDGQRCRAAVDRLGAWARGGLSRRERVQVDAHLDGCARCRELADELLDVNGNLRAVIAPIVLGTAAVGYLATGAGAAAGGAGAAGAGAAGAAGSGVGHAAGSLPRQATTSGFSAGALAVAVAVALTGAAQPKPVAAPPPPPPAVVQPPPPAPAPAPPPRRPAAPARPAPEPHLDGSSPGQPVVLVPGGPPANLPITVRNTGNGPSGPVTVTLSTPPGVTAEIPGASGSSAHPASTSGTRGSGTVQARSAARPISATPVSATPASASPMSATPVSAGPVSAGPVSATPASTNPVSSTSARARSASPSPGEPASTQRASASTAADSGIRCSPAGSGVSCTSSAGLAPGQSRTFDFRVQASEQARGGEITAHLDGGDTSGVRLAAVPVEVMPSDGVVLRESAEDFSPSAYSRLDLDVRNTGNRPGLAVATATLPPGIRALGMPPECELRADDQREIRCTAQLRPGESFDGEVWLQDRLEGPAGNGPLLRSGPRWITIPARATLGTASDSDSVHVRQEQSWQDGPTGDPDQPWPSTTPDTPDPPVREQHSDGG